MILIVDSDDGERDRDDDQDLFPREIFSVEKSGGEEA